MSVNWFTNNRGQLSAELGNNMIFKKRTYNIIAFNVPLTLDPVDARHCSEICEVNGWANTTLHEMRWAKPANRRSSNQRSAHIILSITDLVMSRAPL